MNPVSQGSFTLPPPTAAPPAPYMPPPSQAPPPPAQPGFSKHALLALIFGLFGGMPIIWDQIAQLEPSSRTTIMMFVASLGFAVAAIVLGIMGMKRANQYELAGLSTGMAVAGLVLGILGAIVDVFVFFMVLLFIALCGACAAGASTIGPSVAAVPFSFRGLLRLAARFVRAFPSRALLAHHPSCDAFETDVHRVGSKVLCAGCVGVVAGAIVGALVLKALGPLASWSQEWLIVGAALAVVGSAPALIGDRGPWTRTVSRIPLGAGIAAYAMGLASLPLGGASAAFAVAGAATLVLGWLRARAMANRSARHAHTTACGAA